MTFHRPRLVFAALLAGAASLCFSGCPGPCNCPYGAGFVLVTVPAAQSSSIASVTADAACTASIESGEVAVMTATPGSCQVRATLANGDTYAFTATFHTMVVGNDCKCTVLPADTTAPELVSGGDGGTD